MGPEKHIIDLFINVIIRIACTNADRLNFRAKYLQMVRKTELKIRSKSNTSISF